MDATMFNKILLQAAEIPKHVADSVAYIEPEIIDMVQTDQLYEKGQTASGKTLRTDRATEQGRPYYSVITSFLKGAYGQGRGRRISNVTLYDTGDFYRSWKLRVDRVGFQIQTNMRDIYFNFTNMFGSSYEMEAEIAAPNDKTKQKIIKRITPLIIGAMKV